jgi:zinc protease
VTDTELKQAKGILLRRIPLGESSFGGIGSQLLTLSQQGKPLDAMTIAGQHYLALTAPEVQQAFAKYVRPGGLVTAVKGPAPKN